MEDQIPPPYVADERVMLDAWLEFHRVTLRLKCDGLSPEQLRTRSVPPSSISLLGLVRHMAEVERNWFRRVVRNEDAPPLYYTEDNRDGDFDDIESSLPEDAFYRWDAECEHAREVVREAPSLDALSVGLRHGERVSLRWIMVHMVEEYARHNGHADFLRERIDGRVGD